VPEAASATPLSSAAFLREERFNAATHAVGLALAVVGTAVLLSTAARHGGRWQVLGCAVYSITLVAAYLASTLSHLFHNPRARGAFRIADQALIFLFIAGSFLPVALTWLRSPWWWVFHVTMWCVALTGFVSKALFAHRVEMGAVSAALYLVLGWSPVTVAKPLIATCPAPLLGWFLAGGICYTAGLLFFRYDSRVPYFHAAWHVCVIAGSAVHYMGILRYCAAMP
jgi:hemolysin III